MKLTVTEAAATWYKDEMMLEGNETIRFLFATADAATFKRFFFRCKHRFS